MTVTEISVVPASTGVPASAAGASGRPSAAARSAAARPRRCRRRRAMATPAASARTSARDRASATAAVRAARSASRGSSTRNDRPSRLVAPADKRAVDDRAQAGQVARGDLDDVGEVVADERRCLPVAVVVARLDGEQRRPDVALRDAGGRRRRARMAVIASAAAARAASTLGRLTATPRRSSATSGSTATRPVPLTTIVPLVLVGSVIAGLSPQTWMMTSIAPRRPRSSALVRPRQRWTSRSTESLADRQARDGDLAEPVGQVRADQLEAVGRRVGAQPEHRVRAGRTARRRPMPAASRRPDRRPAPRPRPA